MSDKQKTPDTAQAADQQRPVAQGTPPRGNPERDHESVHKGEEQLDKIAGN